MTKMRAVQISKAIVEPVFGGPLRIPVEGDEAA
jgi:hypothetical protein